MSEPTCGNCKSAADTTLLQQDFECGSWNMRSDGGPTGFHKTPACELIRSLREELATTKTQLDTAMAITFNDARDAERDRIAQYVLHLCYIDLAKALRNNEHRSDT